MLIGRQEEAMRLQALLKSDKSEFVAVYGRRRIGKTYLIRESYNYRFAFQHTGLYGASTADQLKEFYGSMRSYGLKSTVRPKTWYEAFEQLQEVLNNSGDDKKVIFIDELPWMDTAKSNFISALEHFWNAWASARKDIVLIVCGSATSWIMDKIILNYGGLHNRLTARILLQPFTLKECELFAQAQGLVMSRKDLIEAYMIMGGVPYYWTFLQKGLSLAQNIDRLFFQSSGELYLEFQALYASLFKNATLHVAIVEALGNNKGGLNRQDILDIAKLNDNGVFTKALNELEYCGFVRKYYAVDKKRKQAIYQLIDNYTLFYYQYILTNAYNDQHFWSSSLASTRHSTWAGIAFERVCMQHVEQIKAALGISGVLTNVYSWQTKPTDELPGAQIDLLIDRQDGVINLCEAKFSSTPYVMTQEEELALVRRQAVFVHHTKIAKTVHPILLTTFPPVENVYLRAVQKVITMDQLFM